jgi:hypothetical protein
MMAWSILLTAWSHCSLARLLKRLLQQKQSSQRQLQKLLSDLDLRQANLPQKRRSESFFSSIKEDGTLSKILLHSWLELHDLLHELCCVWIICRRLQFSKVLDGSRLQSNNWPIVQLDALV